MFSRIRPSETLDYKSFSKCRLYESGVYEISKLAWQSSKTPPVEIWASAFVLYFAGPFGLDLPRPFLFLASGKEHGRLVFFPFYQPHYCMRCLTWLKAVSRREVTSFSASDPRPYVFEEFFRDGPVVANCATDYLKSSFIRTIIVFIIAFIIGTIDIIGTIIGARTNS